MEGESETDQEWVEVLGGFQVIVDLHFQEGPGDGGGEGDLSVKDRSE